MGFFENFSLILLVICSLEGVSTTSNQSSFQVLCDFGSSHYLTSNTVTVNGSLTSHFNNARKCHVKRHSKSAILRVTLAEFDSTSNISALYSMVLENLNVLFVGVAQSNGLQDKLQKYHFHACPQSLMQEPLSTMDLDLLFFGAPANASFKLEIELDDSVLTPGELANVSVRADGLTEVKTFDIAEDQLSRLVQITVSSDDAEMECVLVVSQSCFATQSEGLAEKSSDDEKQAIQLTFTESGRITLSQYSRPKIMTGRWYIGLRSSLTKKNSDQQKMVTVSVTQGYKYDTLGKARPAAYMCIVAILGGLAISIFAHFFLNSDFDECKVPFHLENTAAEGRARTASKGILEHVPDPIPWRTIPLKRWMEIICIAWFKQGVKTYPYLTGVLAISFMVGSAQFVIARWSNMIEEGNRDLCYYNELCYRPIAVADLPSNFMLSNVPYVIHGIFLALSFSFREAITFEVNKSGHKYAVRGTYAKCFRPYDYSVAYALAWALVFEGLFSATYHLCPSRLTFQFDSAFMFIISGLVVIALYNCRVRSENLLDNDEAPSKHPSETTVQAPKYFLFFVAPLLVFNYVGSVRDTNGLPQFFEVAYWIALVIWLVVMYIWTFQKVGVPCRWKNCSSDEKCWSVEAFVKWTWIIIFPLCLLIIGFKQRDDWSQFFLFSCVAAVALTIIGLMSFDAAVSFKRHRSEGGNFRSGMKQLCSLSRIFEILWSNWHRLLFMIVNFFFWVFAMYFFKIKSTTKKTSTPSFSRSRNEECVLWDFFDYHDIWHMLSSFALFMSAYLLIYVTRKVEIYYYVENLYWKSKRSANHEKTGSTEKMFLPKNDGESIGKHDNLIGIMTKTPMEENIAETAFDSEYAHISYV